MNLGYFLKLGSLGKEDPKGVRNVGKGGRFWRSKNSHHIPGVHVTRILLCGFFEVPCPWTEFLNSSHCGLWRQHCPSDMHVSARKKWKQKIIWSLNIHMGSGFRAGALAGEHAWFRFFSRDCTRSCSHIAQDQEDQEKQATRTGCRRLRCLQSANLYAPISRAKAKWVSINQGVK